MSSEVENKNNELKGFEEDLDLRHLKYLESVPIENESLPQDLVERVAKLSLKPKTAEEIEQDMQSE